MTCPVILDMIPTLIDTQFSFLWRHFTGLSEIRSNFKGEVSIILPPTSPPDGRDDTKIFRVWSLWLVILFETDNSLSNSREWGFILLLWHQISHFNQTDQKYAPLNLHQSDKRYPKWQKPPFGFPYFSTVVTHAADITWLRWSYVLSFCSNPAISGDSGGGKTVFKGCGCKSAEPVVRFWLAAEVVHTAATAL